MRRFLSGILLSIAALTGPGFLPAQDSAIYDWSDSLKQFEAVSSLLLENPVSSELREYTRLVISLMPAAGRNNVFRLLDSALKQLEDAGSAGSASWLIIASAMIEAGFPERLKDKGAFLEDWQVSGAWNRYGSADIDYQFQPEQTQDWKKIRAKRLGVSGLKIFPYSAVSGSSGVVYARSSFSVNSGVRVAILTGAECKVFINGKDSGMCRSFSGRYGAAFRLTGSTGYSIMLKFAPGCGQSSWASVFVAGENGSLAGYRTNENARRTPATIEDLLIDYKNGKYDDGGDEAVNIRQLISDSDYHAALDLCEEALEKTPRNYFIFSEYAALLDSMQRDSDFMRLAETFMKTFPDSGIIQAWLAKFYSTRDKEKFIQAMDICDPLFTETNLAMNYVHALGTNAEYDKAAAAAERLISNIPERIITTAGMYSSAGKKEEMRKVLVHGAAETGDARIFYMLGCVDEATGLDPVIYWTKSLESEDLFCDASDMIDVYENSKPGTNIYYTGDYSGVREEFRSSGIRRRVSIRVFESGRFYVSIEDFIPAAMIKDNGGDSFSFLLPAMTDVKPLYVLKVTDVITEPAEYTEFRDGKRTGVEIRNCGDCRYAVVKYSCCINNSGRINPAPSLIPAVMKDEFVEDIRVNVVYTGSGRPGVFINNRQLRGHERINESIFSWNDMLSNPANETVMIAIHRWSDPEDFASWYAGLALVMGRFAESTAYVFPEHTDTASALFYIKREILTGLDSAEEEGLVPDTPESVMRTKSATAVERAFLAMAMLNRAGIKSNIAFGISGDGASIDFSEVLVYVRVNELEWYWLPVSGKSASGGIEGERRAVVVLENNGRIMPLETERIIKE